MYFLGLSQDFPKTFSGLSLEYLRTFSGIFQDFLITFSRYSECRTDCIGLVYDINPSKLFYSDPKLNKPQVLVCKPKVFVYHLENVSPEQEVTCIRMSVFFQFLIAFFKPLSIACPSIALYCLPFPFYIVFISIHN